MKWLILSFIHPHITITDDWELKINYLSCHSVHCQGFIHFVNQTFIGPMEHGGLKDTSTEIYNACQISSVLQDLLSYTILLSLMLLLLLPMSSLADQ